VGPSVGSGRSPLRRRRRQPSTPSPRPPSPGQLRGRGLGTRGTCTAREGTYEAASSRLEETKDAEGQITAYAYNLDDTLAEVSYPNAAVATPSVGFTYDTVYNRLQSMTDGQETTAYTYYAPGVLGAGRLATVDGPVSDDTISYEYDELGRVVSRGLAAFSTTTAYDVLGRIGSVGSPIGSFTYGYDGVTSRPLTLTYPNSQQTSYSYFGGTGDRRLQQIQHEHHITAPPAFGRRDDHLSLTRTNPPPKSRNGNGSVQESAGGSVLERPRPGRRGPWLRAKCWGHSRSRSSRCCSTRRKRGDSRARRGL